MEGSMENNTSISADPQNFTSPCEEFVTQLYTLRDAGVFFYGLTLPYFLLTFPTRIVSLMAFVVQARKESAYRYQIFLNIAELFESFVFFLSRISKIMLSNRAWFRQCYACMFYDAHLANAPQMAAHLWVLTLTICMTGDRIFALSYPIKYAQSIDRHKPIQYTMFVLSIVFTFMFSFLIYFYITVFKDESTGGYLENIGGDWSSMTTPFLFVHTCAKLAGTLVIVILNTILFVLFYYRMNKKKTSGLESIRENKKNQEETDKVRCLFRLTVIQSISCLVANSGEFVYNLITYMAASGGYPDLECISMAAAPFSDITRQLGEIPTFFVMMAFAQPFRRTVISGWNELVMKFGTGGNAVVPIV